ncbi:MAG: DoxX family protein [Pseudolabrys sp.]
MTNPLTRWSPQLLSVLRIISALLFLAHGTAKFFQFPHVSMYDGMALMSPGGIAGVIELVGGALLAVGLFSRIAAFIMSGEMAAAYFMVHAPQGFHPQLNHGELAIMYCFAFLYIAAAGPGPWSLDALRKRA